MLSRLHRRAEELDGLCLRAWGHPHDYGIRQELLSALEWDSSLHPVHARPLIQDLFQQVHDRSLALAREIEAAADRPDGVVHAIAEGAHGLRQSLGSLLLVLKARDPAPPKK